MGRVQISPDTFGLVRSQVKTKDRFAVEVRQHWGDTWLRAKYTQPRAASLVVGPNIGQAKFSTWYGNIKREDLSSFVQYVDQAYNDWFIRIVKISPLGVTSELWTGIIGTDLLQPGASQKGQGYEDFEAFGLAHVLDRDQIRNAKAALSNGTIGFIDKFPTYNVRQKNFEEVTGNRSAAVDPNDGAYYLSDDGEVWSNLDLAQMILARHTPENGPTFVLGGQYQVLEQMFDRFDFYRKTPWQALNMLISRTRGLGLAPIMDDTSNTCILCVFSILGEDLVVGDHALPGNDNAVSLNLDSAYEIQEPMIVTSVNTRYDRVEVRGHPMLICGTWLHDDDSLDDDESWTASIEEEYATAADPEDADLNDNFRKLDKFSALYSKHKVSVDWTGQLLGVQALLSCDDQGNVKPDSKAPFLRLDKHFEHWIPFEEGGDYSVFPPDLSDQPFDAEPVYSKPLAIVGDFNNPGTFYLCDKGAEQYDNSTAHVHIYPREMAFRVEGHIPHSFGLNRFNEIFPAAPWNDDPVWRWEDVLFTAAFYSDTMLKVVATRDGFNAATDIARTKVIDIKDAHYWYVVPGTVVDVDTDGSLIMYQGDGVLRDDSDYLRWIAAFASAWYCKDRRSITVPLVGRIEKIAELGSFIDAAVTAGIARDIGTCLTSIQWEFGRSPKTTIQTQWAEIEFRGE